MQQPAAQLPWGHNTLLLDKLDEPSERLRYAAKAVENGWSRKVLDAQIASDLHGRQGGALTSVGRLLPQPDSELVGDAIKDPYNFEFLSLSVQAKERDLELALLNDIQSFLMEMAAASRSSGASFRYGSLIKRRVRSRSSSSTCSSTTTPSAVVVIDLKIEDFKPEFAGKMSFYMTAVDELERQPADEPSTGLVLCPGRSKRVTEWALRGIDSPVAVAHHEGARGPHDACAERAEAVYGLVCDHLVRVSTPEAADLTKLLEKIFCSVNIALVNRLLAYPCCSPARTRSRVPSQVVRKVLSRLPPCMKTELGA